MVLLENVQCNIILDCIQLKIMSLHIVYYLLDPIWTHSKNEWSQVKEVPHYTVLAILASTSAKMVEALFTGKQVKSVDH